jgi:hypothetical protein
MLVLNSARFGNWGKRVTTGADGAVRIPAAFDRLRSGSR